MSEKLMGRYDVLNELGQSRQGTVYLAKDSRMSRQVVVRKLGPGSAAQYDAMLNDARDASALQHPNIIPIYDLGIVNGSAFLVYAYISSETLAQLLNRSGALAVTNAIGIVVDLLDALAVAHGKSLSHLGIKPSNVIISATGQNFLTDFCIEYSFLKNTQSFMADEQTLLYRAPEVVAKRDVEARSDIYSMGILLHEMLTGTPVLVGRNAELSGNSQVKVNEKLMAIILRATEAKAVDRYSSALEMRQALMEYMETLKAIAAGIPDADITSTLKFLVRRIRSKNDFPAISGIINEINKIVESGSEDSNRLAQVILQDYSLTNKLLKLVNTVSYSQFGGKINTISKAVSILGIEPVRNIAMSLVVMDFLQNKSQAQELKNVVISSFFSGIVAVQLSAWKSAQEVEEAMICAMFFNLGKMLTKFYLFDECEEISRIMEEKGVDEEAAAVEILGISYNELGIGIAKSWNFPESLLMGMRKLDDKAIISGDNIDRLNVAVNMANELSHLAPETDQKTRAEGLRKISARYAGVEGMNEEKLSSALAKGLQDLTQRSKVFGIDSSKSPMLINTKAWAEYAKNAHAASNVSVGSLGGEAETQVEGEIEKTDYETFLNDGLLDVAITMKTDFKLNDILQMVLETIYRGLGFKHVLIFSRDAKSNMMVARFGFGENIANILPGFNFSLNYEADVFHLSLSKGLDVVIEDVGAPNIANKIPDWYAKAIDSRCFLLLPMNVNNKPVGLIYADMLEAKQLQISPSDMSLLRDLRDLAVSAIMQKTQK